MEDSQAIEIDVAQVKSLLDADAIKLIDCREENEYEAAHIEGSTLLPMSRWNEASEKLEEFQGQHLVVHCHHGMRSLRVVNWLRENGFPDAQSMTGGIDAWSQQIDPNVPQY